MKKIISSILSLAMVLSMSTSAFAAIITTSGGSNDTLITYGMNESFTVTIPTDFSINNSGKATADVSASNVIIGSGKTLEVQISGDDYIGEWELVDVSEPTNVLIYTIGTSEGASDIGDDSVVLSVASGEAYNKTVSQTLYFAVTDELTKAGTYADTLTFTVSVENAVELISFIILDSPTNSEIYTTYYAEKDMTWEEWIGSKYSTEDFSITGSQILKKSSYDHVYDNDENMPVRKSDTIISNGWYYLY